MRLQSERYFRPAAPPKGRRQCPGGEAAVAVESGRSCGGGDFAAPRPLLQLPAGPRTLRIEDYAPPGVSDSGLHARRRRLHASALRRVGVDLSEILVGNSDALRRLEEAIVKVAQADLPAVIEAEFGSGELAAAAAIHCLSARNDAPFVVLRCACQQPDAFQSNLCAAIGQAAGGSLFLSEVDMLDAAMQKDLLAALTAAPGAHADVRLLAAASRPLADLAREGRFCRHLGAHLEMLKVRVPPLRARPSDIRPLVEYEIAERLRSTKGLSEPALQACEQYEWPENLAELRRSIARLVVMSDADRIGMEELKVYTPSIPRAPEPPSPEEPDAPAAEASGDAGAELDRDEETPQGMRAIAGLARDLADGRVAGLDRYGLGMQRALAYVSERYQNDISLGELSASAHLSPSHLSFLFKKTLGAPFKAVLAAVRIEKAKQLLSTRPGMSVTEVSLEVGFGDLSHFEKTFKRVVGTNPREFRRRWSDARAPAVNGNGAHKFANPVRGFPLNGNGAGGKS